MGLREWSQNCRSRRTSKHVGCGLAAQIYIYLEEMTCGVESTDRFRHRSKEWYEVSWKGPGMEATKKTEPWRVLQFPQGEMVLPLRGCEWGIIDLNAMSCCCYLEKSTLRHGIRKSI